MVLEIEFLLSGFTNTIYSINKSIFTKSQSNNSTLDELRFITAEVILSPSNTSALQSILNQYKNTVQI